MDISRTAGAMPVWGASKTPTETTKTASYERSDTINTAYRTNDRMAGSTQSSDMSFAD